MDGAHDLVHATAIAVGGHAALIRGPSGAGKSDLALRCICNAPSPRLPMAAQLVSDDQVAARLVDGAVHLSAPPSIRDQMEVRGLGIIPMPAVEARLALVVDLMAPEAVPRLPDPPPGALILGIWVPRLDLAPFQPSAPLKLLIALDALRGSTNVG